MSDKTYASLNTLKIFLDNLKILIDNHNVSNISHNDIRNKIEDISTRLNTLADCDDETLDQISEIVVYCKDNRELIEQITTAKVSVSDLINLVYPVGSIYMSVNNTSPAIFLGGTWERLTDRFLLGAGNSYSALATGGETTHTLTVNEMPSHYHQAYGISIATVGDSINLALRSTALNNRHFGDAEMRTTSTGSGAAHNNMPPYLAVYMWKRTA